LINNGLISAKTEFYTMIWKIIDRIKNKILIPFKIIPRQGLSSEKLALSFTIGIVGGSFPVIGFTSLVSLLLLIALKQNFTIVQALNWIAAPIQLVMIIPFMRLGATVLFKDNLSITLGHIIKAFNPGVWEGLKTVGLFHLYGLIGWLICAFPAGVIIYFIFFLIFRYLRKIKYGRNEINSSV
jgi:uncharacterized protein (DUF2062 family)